MEQSTVSKDLFDKIRSRFEGMQMADAEAKTTLDPTEAKFFTFEVNTGEVSVSIADSKSMKVFYAKDITDGMTEDVMYALMSKISLSTVLRLSKLMAVLISSDRHMRR